MTWFARRRYGALRRALAVGDAAEVARADAVEAWVMVAAIDDDEDSRASIDRSAEGMNEAATGLEQVADRYFSMFLGREAVADDDADGTS